MAGLNGRVRRFPPGFFFWAGSGEHELGHALDHRVRAARLKVSGRVAVRIQVALEHGLQHQSENFRLIYIPLVRIQVALEHGLQQLE